VHLQPVEDTLLDRLGEVARLGTRLLLRVAAHEGRPLEDGVVELARLDPVRADCADERPRAQPFPAEEPERVQVGVVPVVPAELPAGNSPAACSMKDLPCVTSVSFWNR
jgi:hypothetical protein